MVVVVICIDGLARSLYRLPTALQRSHSPTSDELDMALRYDMRWLVNRSRSNLTLPQLNQVLEDTPLTYRTEEENHCATLLASRFPFEFQSLPCSNLESERIETWKGLLRVSYFSNWVGLARLAYLRSGENNQPRDAYLLLAVTHCSAAIVRMILETCRSVGISHPPCVMNSLLKTMLARRAPALGLVALVRILREYGADDFRGALAVVTTNIRRESHSGQVNFGEVVDYLYDWLLEESDLVQRTSKVSLRIRC